jgi:ubiquinone/menaquinone biosynthesis C-methylase UbiE
MPQKRHKEPRRKSTPSGWDAVADWYDGWVGKGGSEYHRKVAIPALLDVLDAQSGEQIIDIGAGQGVLAPFIDKAGAKYTGVDVSPKLLSLARNHHGKHGRFLRADANNLLKANALRAQSFDAAVFLLSIQDMNPLDDVLGSATWALKQGGRVVVLMTHPAFRVPRQSGWGFDEKRKLQYRRVDSYLSELPVPMKQHSEEKSGVTISFHRPISAYVNGMAACGLLIDRMDEIAIGDFSMKKNRPKAEKRADHEIPVFLVLRALKV